MKMAWIFKRSRECVDEFWTGEVDRDGELVTSMHRCDAFHFRTPGVALLVAETHAGLRESDEWRVVRR